MQSPWHKLHAVLSCSTLPALSFALGLLGCAGTQRAELSQEARANQAFARIQVYEAQISAAERNTAAPECSLRCEGASTGGQASEAICKLAQELSDADALSRCDQARAHGQALRAAAASCDCAGTAN